MKLDIETVNKEINGALKKLGVEIKQTDKIDPFEFESLDDILPKNFSEQLKKFEENNHAFDKDAGYTVGDNSFDPNEAWIQTYSGKRFTPLKPNINAVVIQDIAHSLSMQCRFNGHTHKFYSVAEHSVLVSYFCDKQDKLHGLLHDASEYVLCDIPTPLKRSSEFKKYKDMEKVVQDAIYKRFGLSVEEPKSVKDADMLLLSTEASQLITPRSDWKLDRKPLPIKLSCLSPLEAKQLFLNRFYELMEMSEFIK